MEEIKIHGIYKHFKGDLYIVEDIAKDSETEELLVIYRALYGNNELWCRKYSNFIEEVNKGNQKHRFEFQEIKSQRD